MTRAGLFLLSFFFFLTVPVWGQDDFDFGGMSAGGTSDGQAAAAPEPARNSKKIGVADVFDLFKSGEANVQVASGVKESLLDAPASIVVITAREIKNRGYTNLAEVLYDLPGFDVAGTNGTSFVHAYQRGYRTPATTRTLLMFNGVVDNDLWSHIAEFSRQYPVSNIKRIEVLYGPAAAVYGPNAFAGIINVVTYDGKGMADGTTFTSVNMMGGSFNTRSVDATSRGQTNGWYYSAAARIFKSDEPDFSGRASAGHSTNEKLGDLSIWGPILNYQHRGVYYGKYYDPTDDYGVMANVGYKGFKFTYVDWAKREGYGTYYVGDRSQNNAFWTLYSRQYISQYEKRINKRLSASTLVSYRENARGGHWVEAEPNGEDESWISITEWNTSNTSWLAKQKLDFQVMKSWLLSGGVKFERKELSKAYDIGGYWSGSFDSGNAGNAGPIGYGAGINDSTASSYDRPNPPAGEVPPSNLFLTEDVGGYVQSIYDISIFRFNTGIRYDRNSLYGESVNPRLSAITKVLNQKEQKLAVKLLYGTAFQEPSAQLLFGGWTGRKANPLLQPENVQNYEAVIDYQYSFLFLETSGFLANYQDVIKEEALNAGERQIYGAEAKLYTQIPNFIPKSSKITTYTNYTYTVSKSNIFYNFNPDVADWQETTDIDNEVGDIAPHKINFGVNIPIYGMFNLNTRLNWVSTRPLYSRNEINNDGVQNANEEIEGYFLLNMTAAYIFDFGRFTFKVINLLDTVYDHPGGEGAEAGIDYSSRSLGYTASLLPQPRRYFEFMLTVEF